MSGSTTPTKQAVAPAKPVKAFGIEVAAPTKSSAEISPEMSQKKKRLILAGSLLGLTAIVLWLQYRPTSDPDPEAAAHPAVVEVANLAKKGDVDGLKRMTRNDDPVVAQRAMTSLASVGRFDALRDSLNDHRPDVRAVAVAQLGKAEDVSQLPALAPYTQDPAPEVRIAAMRSIASIRDFSIFDQLVPMLSDPQPSVRRAAIQAIQDRVGLQFPDYNPEDAADARGRAIARIRAALPKMKQVFDRANEFELRRLKQK